MCLSSKIVEVIKFGLRCKVSTKTHRNGTSAKFGETTGHDQGRATKRRKASSKSEWDRETIGKADNNITNNFGADQMSLIISLEVLTTLAATFVCTTLASERLYISQDILKLLCSV